MSTLTSPRFIRSTTIPLAIGAVIALAANAVVALAAIAAGASASYPPLTLPVYGAFTIVGVLVGFIGWRAVRGRARHPRSTFAWLVPTALVVSLVPDVLVLVTGAIPGTTLTGAVALMIMHGVVAAVVVPLSAKLAPVS